MAKILIKGMIDIHSNERDYRKANYRIKNEDLKMYR